MSYRDEFPEFGELDVEIPEGFTDNSWHNDVCPSFICQIDEVGDYIVKLSVDHKDPEKRELQGYPRFLAQVDKYGIPVDHFGTDDWSAAVEWAQNEVKKAKGK